MENKVAENIKISVIVPSYNQGKYIENCIKSVVKQTYSNWELIIQDGASKDDTKDICAKYTQDDPRIFFYSEKDKGYADAVNKALDKVSGTLAVIQSSDDFFAYNNVFQDAINYYRQNHNLILISGAAVTVDEDLNLLSTQERADKYVPIENIYTLKDHFSQGATFFDIKRAFLIGKLDPTVDMVADTDFWVRLTASNPIPINSVLLTSKIWGGVTVQAEQRSADLSQFYLGRAKMAVQYVSNSSFPFPTAYKKAHANNLISTGITHFKLLKKDYGKFLVLYKELNGKDYLDKKKVSIKSVIKTILGLNQQTAINSKDEMYVNNNINPLINFRWFDN